LGYGPRFLHSTGQLYKGGQNTGLFLQLSANHEKDLPIPGKPYSFGTVADAQALGDFRALEAAGRLVVRMNLPNSKASVIEALVQI
jgi:transaldolase/glucose-6-phosphate isomerase